MTTTSREYRDRLFTFIFGSEEHLDWTLSLYNAVNGTDHDDPSAIQIATIREVLYLGMHNDVSFLLADGMSLYEQQSTYNPNMPLRMMQYAGQMYERHVKERRANKFGRALISLPAPRLVVFYNGAESVGADTVLRLSDSFPEGAEADIEVCVRMIDISRPGSHPILEDCQPLREYVWTVDRIRYNMANMDATRAVDEAIEAIPDGFAIRPYLLAHKAEVRDMLLTEYNEAEAMELFREEGRAEGRAEGRGEGRDSERAANIRSLVEALDCTAERAMELLSIPEAERARYLGAV